MLLAAAVENQPSTGPSNKKVLRVMGVQARGKHQLCAVPDPFLLSWSSTAAKRSLGPVNQSRLWASWAPAEPIRCGQANAVCADWLTTPLLAQSSGHGVQRS